MDAVETSDLTKDEAVELGAFAGALIGFGAAGEEGAEAGALAGAAAAESGASPLDDEVWFVADTIPPGTTRRRRHHRAPLGASRCARRSSGRAAKALADAWLHPSDLVAPRAAQPAGADEPARAVSRRAGRSGAPASTASERQETSSLR